MRKQVIFFVAAIPLAAVRLPGQQRCEDLSRLALPDIVIQSAAGVPPGSFSLPGSPASAPPVKVPAFCRVAGLVKPELRFELWLPAEWNRKYIAVGNGGMAGSVPFTAMVDPLKRGYAVGATDTGHIGASDDGAWALGRLDRLLNYAYRGIHLMALADQAVTRSYCGAAPANSYFNGCSFGGKQALTETQCYPNDFNGIIAGDPANAFTRHYIGGHLWDAMAMDGDGYIPASRVAVLGNAVNAACDALDGIRDGVLNDPRRCHFDPAVLQCKGSDEPGCLTAAQVGAVKKVWGGLKDSSGRQIYPGLMPGGEASPGSWARYFSGTGPGSGRHTALTNAFFSNMVFENPAWDFHSFRFTAPAGLENDIEATEDKVGWMFNATNPDLRPFRAHGGKLIQYHGWSDPDIPPDNSINYHDSVAATVDNSDGLYRLFMVPGMQHCTGGPVTFSFDSLSALEQWVEQGKAPDQMPAAHLTAGKVDRMRPLSPYPQVAKHKGTGSTDDAANFICSITQ